VAPASADVAVAPVTRRIAAEHLEIGDFLTPDENRQLLDYALASEPQFQGSSVTTAVEDYRRSRVLFAIRDSRWCDVILKRLKLYLPHIAAMLDVPPFDISEFEIQLTASNDGDYFKPHPDAGQDQHQTSQRRITYVYYLHRTPRPFSGGDLLIYGKAPGPPGYDLHGPITSIAPRNNSLVAFASDRWHEVDLIRCPSRTFADSRFTVNGWLRAEA
jgi:Rps23 Pro-64 3,4-dihydroxylase Tpa1-like proline 4-hydroxylase